MNVTQKISQYLETLSYEDIDRETIEYCKLLIADYLAACAAGRIINPVLNRAAETIMMRWGGAEESRPIFSNQKIPCANAAFLYGVYCHGADIDDGHRGLMGHPGAPVISAVLPMAEQYGKSGEETVLAVVAGYEVCIRLGKAMQPALVHRGFHSTGVVGAVAAAAACGKLLGLSADTIENAMALGMTQAGGLLMVAESGQMSKPVNPARAAYSGVLAALLAKEGVQASRNALESEKGFFHAFAEPADAETVLARLGEEFLLKGSYIKPYPSCRHTHGVIDAAERLYGRYESWEEIEKANVYIYPHAISIAGQIVTPKCIDDAKFSIHYALACTLADGSFGLHDLTECETRIAELEPLLQRIELICDESMERQKEGIRGAKVELLRKDGSILEEEVSLPKGDPEAPFDWEDMRRKLGSCGRGVFSEKTQERLLEIIRTLETAENLNELLEIVSNIEK